MDSNGAYKDVTLEVGYVVIIGGRLIVGWENNTYLGNMEIILSGSQDSELWPLQSTAVIGQKVIGELNDACRIGSSIFVCSIFVFGIFFYGIFLCGIFLCIIFFCGISGFSSFCDNGC